MNDAKHGLKVQCEKICCENGMNNEGKLNGYAHYIFPSARDPEFTILVKFLLIYLFCLATKPHSHYQSKSDIQYLIQMIDTVYFMKTHD